MAQHFKYDGIDLFTKIEKLTHLPRAEYAVRPVTTREAAVLLSKKYRDITIQRNRYGAELINGFQDKGFIEVNRENKIVHVVSFNYSLWYVFTIPIRFYDQLKNT